MPETASSAPQFSSKLLNINRTEATVRAELVTVHDYQVRLDLRTAVDQPEAGFRSETQIVFDAADGGETFLDFVGLSVDRVLLNGTELKSEDIAYDGARIRLSGLTARNQVLVNATAAYSRSGEGMHRYVDPQDGKIYLYTQSEPADARRVFANFEQPDLKAHYRFEVIAPSHWHVAGNGAEESCEQLPKGAASMTLNRWRFARTKPISSYMTCIFAGEYVRFNSSWPAQGNSAPNHPGASTWLLIAVPQPRRSSTRR